MNVAEALRKWIYRKRHAYRAVFQPGGVGSIASGIVLADLAKFCRAQGNTTVVCPTSHTVDPFASMQLAGRREVWLRITQNLNMSDLDLQRLVEHEAQQQSETE